MILGRTEVGRILECDPGMPRLEDHRENLAPDHGGLDPLKKGDLPAISHRLVLGIALLKSASVEIMKIGHIARAEKGPLAVFTDALHEQVGNPVGRVHVVRATAFVTHILAELQKVLDIEMPCFEIGTHRPLSLASLVHGYSRVIGHFEERNDSLALTIGSLDQGACASDICPVITKAPRPLRELGVVADALENVIEVIHHRGQIAGAQLGMERPAVEQRRCRRGEKEA